MIENDLYYEETSYQFFTSNFTPDGYACLRDRFLGPYRTERNPLAVETGVCEVPGQKGGNHCGVLQKNVTLAPGEEARLLFLLGEGGLGAGKAAKARWTPERADEDFARLAKFWDRKLSCLQVSTPNEGMNTELTSGTSIRARSTSCSPGSPPSSRWAAERVSATGTPLRTP